jgi:hypothetical protein
MAKRYNPPPNWPAPPAGWTPPPDWQPDPAWGPPPPGWQVWVDDQKQAAGSRPVGWIIAVVAAFLVGIGVGAAATGGNGSTPTSAASTGKTSTAPTTSEATTAAPAEEPEVQYDDPAKDDFELKVKTLSKHCFGSAGCNVTFRVSLGYRGVLGLDPDKTYEITYEIRGGEDAMIGTVEATGDNYTLPDEDLISTRSSGARLRAVVIDVSEL